MQSRQGAETQRRGGSLVHAGSLILFGATRTALDGNYGDFTLVKSRITVYLAN